MLASSARERLPRAMRPIQLPNYQIIQLPNASRSERLCGPSCGEVDRTIAGVAADAIHPAQLKERQCRTSRQARLLRRCLHQVVDPHREREIKRARASVDV